MSEVLVTCSVCGTKYYMYNWQSKACPYCGRVSIGSEYSGSLDEIEVTCNNCGTVYYMYSHESKGCPHCGKIANGPKA